jgi:hypothetical protein
MSEPRNSEVSEKVSITYNSNGNESEIDNVSEKDNVGTEMIKVNSNAKDN